MVFGRPHRFVSGQWKGRSLRFSLEVAQSPEVGRKSSTKDRRPITNIPIVRMRARQVDPRTGAETEVDVDTIDIGDFAVSAELFSPASPAHGDPSSSSSSSSSSFTAGPSDGILPRPPERRSYFTANTSAEQGGDSAGSSGSTSGQSAPTGAERNILGDLATSAVRLNDLDGMPAIWFFYHDIAIRAEGDYSLRFQFFDLESCTDESPDNVPILAECFSDPFTVHAPRNYPGVPPTTRLIKHFASQGYRLTVKKPVEDSGYSGAPADVDDEASDDDTPPALVGSSTSASASQAMVDGVEGSDGP